jgi:putative ABC transport system ATP-binding protein
MTDEVVALRDVSFSWGHTAPALAAVTLSLKRGERLFIRGPSGSGKTTLISLIGGLLTPQTGSVRVLGHDLTRMRAASRDRFRADHIGFIFQLFNLVPYLSVIDNVTLPCRFSARRRNKATQTCSLDEQARDLLSRLKLPETLFSRHNVNALSVGQQQRVAAARALIGTPELVIADEPTSALDYDARDAFLELLFAACRAADATLLFVSHDPTLARHFDRVVQLHPPIDAQATRERP